MALSIAWLGRFFLPLVGILFFGCGEWTYGIVAFVAWASLVLLFRWRPLRYDREDWPNDQENI
jgi:hypothetical protein